MKTTIKFSLLALSAIFILSAFTPTSKKLDDPKYYVAVAWEYTYDNSKSGEPVVSNVVYVNCENHSSLGVTNALGKYYDAYYRKSRGTSGLERAIGFSFNTEGEAIAKRRELIADYNYKWNPLIINQFSVPCN